MAPVRVEPVVFGRTEQVYTTPSSVSSLDRIVIQSASIKVWDTSPYNVKVISEASAVKEKLYGSVSMYGAVSRFVISRSRVTNLLRPKVTDLSTEYVCAPP